VTAGLPPGAIEIVVVDPADSAHLFALGHYQACATSADGLVFESRDSGASWKRVRFCAGVADVISIEFSRADPRCLWADNGRGEVAHSVDGGLTWTPVRFPPGVEPRPLVADLGDARTLHANVEQGLWRSADSGVKWVQVASFPSSDAAWRLRVADPFDHRSFYGWRGDFSAKDLGRTTDAGATWKVCAPLPTDPSIMNLLPDVTRRGGLFVHSRDGLHRSTDGGLSWSSVAPMPMSSTAYWGEHGLVQAPGGELYVLWEGDRIFRSSDRASSWELVFAGPAEERAQPGIRALALGRSAPRVLYAATFWNGVLRSGDGGRTWKPINQGLTGSHISSLVEDPHDRNVLYCTTMPGGLHRSRDGGRSWSPVKAPAGRLVMAMALDRRNPGLLYLATDEGFLKSGDGGKTWTMRNRGLGDRPLLVRLAVDPDDPRGLFAQGIGGTVFVSRDAGESWSPVEPPVSTPDVQRQLAPSSERVVLFESRKGAGSVSLDGGRTWTPVSGPGAPRSVSCMRISSREPSVFYVGTGSGCLFRSDDSGVSWVALGRTSQPGSAGAQLGDTAGGLLANDAVNCIIEDPLDENTLYAATQSGLFVSRDGGRTLVRQETNPRLKSVNSIVLSRDEGRVLTLGTSGGMFQTRLPAPGSLPPGGPR
jgi:photosystem II stability/assembly factor-like uncharacterized protein